MFYGAIVETDLIKVLKADGVDIVYINGYQNNPITSLDSIIEQMSKDDWAVRIIYNDRFGGVLISQSPGKGNRLHYHPDTDECWIILKGQYEWFIDGMGSRIVSKNDIVLVPKNIKHKITCIGNESAIRFAITKPDVEHIYEF